MAEWAARRFWKEATVEARGDGFAVLLDGRPIKTPAGAPLSLPTADLARAVADEWAAQQEVIDPNMMPLTRMANSAIDKVGAKRAEVIAMLTEYGDTDLLNYRATEPLELIARQSEAWDPILDWAAGQFGVRMKVTQGVMPVAQDPQALAMLAAPMHEMSDFGLTAFHDLVTLSGSLVLALALVGGARDATEIWDLSRLDERWQAELWGEDEEAAEQAELKKAAFLDAVAFWSLHRM
ncbi:ATP12 family chaperone protein [Palleronia caenipelagi]|uniref:ATPase n=1 Tax=Palleronia caenipelagi TaxID=2489174 RepID=A0A547Q9W4_9RHOB|nr:ATP12 family protein [Palleronia caenipelagi]TRD23179.1 ATPase [Palleronia caenipelagi]